METHLKCPKCLALFEFVEGKSDQDLLDEFLCKKLNNELEYNSAAIGLNYFKSVKSIARELANAIKPEFLEKLRKES